MSFKKQLGHSFRGIYYIPTVSFQFIDGFINNCIRQKQYASNLLGRDKNNIHPVDSSPLSSQENIVHPHTVQSSCHMWSDSGSGTPPGNSLQMFLYDILKSLKALSFSYVNLHCCLCFLITDYFAYLVHIQ